MPKAGASAILATRIRKAVAADLPAVVRIESELFSSPWSGEYFAAELENSLAHFYVAEEDAGGGDRGPSGPGGVPAAPIVGFLLFWRLGDVLELHRIAVDRDHQRRGHAARLMAFFIETGRALGGGRAVLEVRASNAAAIALYARHGFRLAGRRRAYYSRPEEDALVYETEVKAEGGG